MSAGLPADDVGPRHSALETLLNASATGALTTDRQGRLLWSNAAALHILGLSDEMLGDHRHGALLDMWALLPQAVIADGAPEARTYWSGDMRRRGTNGLQRTVGVEAMVRRDPQGICCEMTALLRDVSEASQLHAELLHQASHDALTGLPNRAHLRRASADCVERLRNTGGTAALLFVDLDHVKDVNDVAGHEVGDRLIVHAGQRLANSVRPRDLVARLGGDEFVVLCHDMVDSHTALEAAERLRRTLSERVDVAGHSLAVAASVGVAVLTADMARRDARPAAEVADTLLQQADSAMYLAKQRGRGRSELFDEALAQDLAHRRARSVELAEAMARERLTCTWYPVTDLLHGATTAWYAEAHWTLADGTELGHGEIMDLAPAAGVELAIGTWLLQQAATAPRSPGRRRVMIPCTGVQLANPRTIEVARAMADHLRAQAGSLSVLVDETVLTADDTDLDRALRALPRFGIGLVVTGVGGGSTPLRRLGELAVERLILHPELIAGLDDSPVAEGLVRSLVHLGHTLDMVVGAEPGRGDATTRAHRVDRLRLMGCDEIVERPVTAGAGQELTAN